LILFIIFQVSNENYSSRKKQMNSKYKFLSRSILLIVTLSVIALFLWDCSNPKNEGSFYSNIPPKTRLSNVPPLNDTIITKNPRVTLNWVGDDPDGYVVGFRYRWSFRLSKNEPFQYKPYSTVLNLIVEKFALMVETDNPKIIPSIYKYFANVLGGDGLQPSQRDSLSRGDSIWVLGVRVFASNPDSIRLQTGQRVKYSFPVHENPNTGTFIFDSQDTLNFHTFEVSAIDNVGDTSAVSAKVSFWTPQVVPPHGFVESGPEDTVFVLMDKTPTFKGIYFSFKGVDPNSRTIDYRWVVDKDIWLRDSGYIPWSDFSPTEYAYVFAKDFPDPYATVHTFYVQARNEFGSIDTIGITRAPNGAITDTAWYTFYTIYPPTQRPGLQQRERILIINNCYDYSYSPTITHPSYDTVEAFYKDILVGLGKPDTIIDIWRAGLAQNPSWPSRRKISEYTLVIYVADVVNDAYVIYKNGSFVNLERLRVLRDYCYVGGDLIMSGWGSSSDQNTQRVDEFFRNVVNVDLYKIRFDKNDRLIRTIGTAGYPNLYIDSTKADTNWISGMSNVFLNYPYGFGEIIQKYDSKLNSLLFENQPISVRYLGITFNSAYFGVPLFYFQRPAVDSTIAHILYDFKISKERRQP